MILVNKYWLDDIWGSIGEGQKVDKISGLNMNNESSVKILVREYINPHFGEIPKIPYRRIKETFRFALNVYGDNILRRALESMLPQFETPRDIRSFYVQVWDFLFNNEPWKIEDITLYKDIEKEASTPWDDI